MAKEMDDAGKGVAAGMAKREKNDKRKPKKMAPSPSKRPRHELYFYAYKPVTAISPGALARRLIRPSGGGKVPAVEALTAISFQAVNTRCR